MRHLCVPWSRDVVFAQGTGVEEKCGRHPLFLRIGAASRVASLDDAPTENIILRPNSRCEHAAVQFLDRHWGIFRYSHPSKDALGNRDDLIAVRSTIAQFP